MTAELPNLQNLVMGEPHMALDAEPTLNVADFLRLVGEDVIREFDRATGAGHAVEKGSLGESAARKNLERALPQYMKVSSGFVLDSRNFRSLQTDIIVHEQSCPRFTLGQDENFTYFPCEGVAAVGEVKTTLTKAEIEDCYSKVASAKRLERRPGRNSYRHYGSAMPVYGGESDVHVRSDPEAQILGFVLCKRLAFSPRRMMEHIRRLDAADVGGLNPALFVSLDDGAFVRFKAEGSARMLTHHPQDYSHIAHIDFRAENFSFLVNQLTEHIVRGKTTAESPIRPYLPQFRDMTIHDCIPKLSTG